MQTAEMAQLQEQWKDKPGLKLVSFSVDPEKDTTAVLSGYADRYKADAQRWLFLTGAKEEISRLVQEGFKLSAVALAGDGNAGSVIMHSPRFVLIDKQAQIRGYYDSRDPQAIQQLKATSQLRLTDKRSTHMAKPAKNKKPNVRADKQGLLRDGPNWPLSYSRIDRHGVDRLSNFHGVAREVGGRLHGGQRLRRCLE